MRLFLLTGIFIFCGVVANAQCYDKFVFSGQLNYIGGGRVVTTEHKIINKGFSLKITPSLGYFLREDLTVGTGIGYEYVTDDRGNQHTFEISTYLRYYIDGGDFRVFVQWEGGYGIGKSKLDGGYGGRHDIWFSTLKPGVWGRIKDNLAIELTVSSLSFKHIKSKDDKTDTSSTTDQWRFDWLDFVYGVGFIFEF